MTYWLWLVVGPAVALLAALGAAVYRAPHPSYAKILAIPGKWAYARFFRKIDLELDAELNGHQGQSQSSMASGKDPHGGDSKFWNEDFKLTKHQFQQFAKICSLTPP
jgi:hypothetical protein